MHAVRILLDSVLDYAGLFPPAKLDMRTTVANFARDRRGPDRWMLARLIVPVTRFPEFVDAADPLLPKTADAEGEEPWPMSVLVAPASDRQIVADLGAGTWYFVLDTYVAAGAPQPGEYLLAIVAE